MAFLARLFQPLARDKTPPVRSAAPVNNDLLGWRRVFRPSFTTLLLYPSNAIQRLLVGIKRQAALLVPHIQQPVRKYSLLRRPPPLYLLEFSQALLKLFLHGDLLFQFRAGSSPT
jgi:hypothetical protein